MTQINLKYLGELKVEAEHVSSGQKLIAEAPVDNQGKGEYFSPTDLVATALPACMSIIMGIVADRHKIDLQGMKAQVNKIMSTEAPRRIQNLKVNFLVPQNLDSSQRALLRNAAPTCPVYKSLHPEIEVDICFDWNGEIEDVQH